MNAAETSAINTRRTASLEPGARSRTEDSSTSAPAARVSAEIGADVETEADMEMEAGQAREANHRAWTVATSSLTKMPSAYPDTPMPIATNPITQTAFTDPSINKLGLSLIHISEPTRLGMISYAVFCLKKKK